MGRRVAVVLSLLALIGVEHFGWYSMRTSIAFIAHDRFEELTSRTSTWVLLSSVVAALLALFVPRFVLLVSGCALALTGALLMFTDVNLTVGLGLQCVGVGLERVLWFTMLAEFAPRPAVKVALIIMSYAVINLGATIATPLPAFPLLPGLVGFGLATVCAALIAVLRFAPGVEAPPSGDPPRAIIALVLAAPVMVLQWELSARAYALPGFDFMSFLWPVAASVCVGCGIAAVAFVTARQSAPLVTAGVLGFGALALAAICVVVVLVPPQSPDGLVAINLASALVEGFVYPPLLGLVIAWSPSRVGPLFATSVSLMSFVVSRLESLPAPFHHVLMLGGSFVALVLAVLVVLMRQKFFAPLTDKSGALGPSAT